MLNILPYAAFLTLLFLLLSFQTIRMRRTLQIGLGDVGNDKMLRAIRVHANFAEYVPLSLIMIYLVEKQNANIFLVHGLCLLLLVGRIFHAFGVSQTKENLVFRKTGMAMTFIVLLASSVYLLFSYFGFHFSV